MWNVFALLVNSDGEAEEVNFGSLYVKLDAQGLLSQIEVEPYSSEDLEEYEAHFDAFDPEFPEVPMRVNLDSQWASIEGFFFQGDSSEVDFEEFEDGQDKAGFDEACQNYEFILKAAYRIYERAQREEPIFVGYVDSDRHKRLDIKEILGVEVPIPRTPIPRRQDLIRTRRREKAKQARQNLCRVRLISVAEPSNEFPSEMVLHIATGTNGFPLRFVPISGFSDAHRPIAVLENGDMRLGDSEGYYTNLMAAKIVQGEGVLVWTNHCRSSRLFNIDSVELFLGAEGSIIEGK